MCSNGPGVVKVVCSLGYRSSSIVVCNFASIVNLYRNSYGHIYLYTKKTIVYTFGPHIGILHC